MAMCVIRTVVSIAFIFLVQIYYAVAPRLPRSLGTQSKSGG